MTLFQTPAFAPIENPLQKINPSGYDDLEGFGLMNFVSNLIKTLIIGAGLFAFINLVMAGLQFISSGGNPEATTKAWQRIAMSLVGLAVMVSSYAIAALAGIILFNDATAILNPKIYGPGQ
jgi:hypothetical protein